MMLAATVEAAADLDVQLYNGIVQLEIFLGEPLAQFRGEAARGGNAQLAGVRARAGSDIHDAARARIGQPRGFQRLMQFQEIALADPAKDDILLDGQSDRFLREAARDVRQ